jgi:hypothetical protein
MGRLRAGRVELSLTAMDAVSAVTLGTVAIGIAGWALAVLFVVSLCQVAARSDRLGARLAASDALGQLEGVRSPSGRPFFPGRRQRRELMRELSDLHVYV